MHDLLYERAAELSRLASTVRTNLNKAEALIPVVNEQLSELAAMGVSDLQVEGPTVYSRPQGLSAGQTDDHCIDQAVVVMAGEIGAAIWNSGDFDEYVNRSYGKPVDLAPRFIASAKCPPVVKALLVTHASHMVASLMEEVRLLGNSPSDCNRASGATARLFFAPAACGDPVAREQVPRLLSDLGVRIGLTFREGRAEKNRKVRRLQGGIIAFGNRPLPCVLRNGAGRPMVGGLAPEAGDHAHDGGCDHGHQDDQPGKARRRAGDKKTLSIRKGKPTGARGGPRGATPHSPVDSKPPRQPPETSRLSKVSRGDRT